MTEPADRRKLRPSKTNATMRRSVLPLLILVARIAPSRCCTNVLVTPGASEDGSAMLGYNTDDTELFGYLFHYAAVNHTRGASPFESSGVRKVYEWETGRYLGTIPEAEGETYNVVGNCNDRGLCIGETTFGGLRELWKQDAAIVDYGSLIWITAMRSSTAREAIGTMSSLIKRYGYHSWGESFSIIDSNEAWIMEIISKGNHSLGGVWVARRIPDGAISMHANRARITTFPRDDPENCLYADDVVDFARELGLFDGRDKDFSFADVFDPKPPAKVRYADARVWDVFSQYSRDADFAPRYFDCATGRGKDPSDRMPLWIEPRKKISLQDMREIMGRHYEGTELDCRRQVSSGLFSAPYRPRPYTWHHDGRLYVNERNIGVEKTGISFVAQIRGWMPPELRALLWFAADDASTAPRFPAYACSTRVSRAYAGRGTKDGVTRPIMKFDMTKAFWVQNMVSNLVYSRWRDAYPVLKSKLDEIHDQFVAQVKEADNCALQIYHSGPDGPGRAVEELTNFSVDAGDHLHQTWTDTYGYLFVRFRDFVTTEDGPSNLACGCRTTEVGYDEAWRERIARETGDHFLVPERYDGSGGGATETEPKASEGKKNRGGLTRGSGAAIVAALLLAVCFGAVLTMVCYAMRKGRTGTLERAVSMTRKSGEERTLLEK